MAILEIRPTLKQHQAYQALDELGVEEVFFGGSAGGGKSWAICESRLMRAYLYPGYKSFIGRTELKRLMQSTFLTFAKVCKFHNIPTGDWKLNGQYNFIQFKNGSRIDLLDLKYLPSEDPLYERFGSLEYSDGAIEEAGEVHPLAREVLKTRVNRHMNDELGINPAILETGNPKKNWTYQIFYKPWKEGRLPDNLRFIQAKYSDNPHTAASYEKTLSGIKDPIMRARLKDGDWEYEDDPAALMDYEAITDMFTNAVEQSEEKYATLDVARYGNDKTVAVIWRGWEAYKIRSREKQGIDQTAEWFKELLRDEGVPYSHAIADEDGIGGGVVDILRGIKGFTANSTPVEENKTEDRVKRSIEAVDTRRAFANLKTQCAYEFAERVNTRKVAVRAHKTQTIEMITEDLEQVKEANVDDDNKKRSLVSKDKVKEVLGRSPDYGDALIMRAYFALARPKGNVVKVVRPKWKGYNRR